jgi:hypothetical protein
MLGKAHSFAAKRQQEGRADAGKEEESRATKT